MKVRIRKLMRHTRGLTLPMLAAVGLTVFATSFYFNSVRPADEELTLLQHRISRLEKQRLRAAPSARQTPQLQLVRFYENFPAEASTPDWLARIHAAAEANHLELMQGDYRMISKEKEQLIQYQITLPLKGRYPDIRGFLNTVLSDLPVASLDSVAFERQKIGEASVQVTVRLTIYLRAGS